MCYDTGSVKDARRTSAGRVVQTIPFAFGQRLSRIKLPTPPEKEGFFGVWPAPEDDTPRSDVILDVEYSPWLTVISSSQAVGDRPLVLADGQFTSRAVLDAAPSAGRAPAGAAPNSHTNENRSGADFAAPLLFYPTTSWAR